MSGIKFGDFHSGGDWGLFLVKVEISAPETQTYTAEVPGRDGVLDLTDVMGDEPRYYNRTLTAYFDVITTDRRYTWNDIISTIYNAVHGRKLKITLDDDPDYYYVGRCTVETDTEEGTIVISADCEPYKYRVFETTVELSGSGTVALANDRMTVVPTVTVSGETMITVDGSSISLSAGTYEMTGFELAEGVTEWEVDAEGATTITYRQGRL